MFPKQIGLKIALQPAKEHLELVQLRTANGARTALHVPLWFPLAASASTYSYRTSMEPKLSPPLTATETARGVYQVNTGARDWIILRIRMIPRTEDEPICAPEMIANRVQIKKSRAFHFRESRT